MTYTILAVDPDEKSMGIGMASGSVGVGERVPWGESGVGLVATQCYTNVRLGRIGLQYLREGYSVQEALAKTLESDSGKEYRQLALLSINGEGAAYTGIYCPRHTKVIVKENLVSTGNLLSSERIVNILVETYLNSEGNLAKRILNALLKSSKSGGDARGDRSSALAIYYLYPENGYVGPRINLHVKSDVDPVKRLFEEYMKMYKED